jgi:hypothetical protein
VYLCDSILERYEQIVMAACKLQSVLDNVYIFECEKSISLLTVVCRNRPKFEAARFFALDKTTLFKTLYTIFTRNHSTQVKFVKLFEETVIAT